MHELVERFIAGAELPARAIAGLTRDDLRAYPVPGTWSLQEIVIHLMDSDLIGTDRMKRVAAEERPLLIGYNETLFIRTLFPQELDAQRACEVFRLNRLLTGEVLRRLPADAFARYGIHSEDGKKTLAQLVAGYADHLDHHLKFIADKRALLGKPAG